MGPVCIQLNISVSKKAIVFLILKHVDDEIVCNRAPQRVNKNCSVPEKQVGNMKSMTFIFLQPYPGAVQYVAHQYVMYNGIKQM